MTATQAKKYYYQDLYEKKKPDLSVTWEEKSNL